MVTPTWTGPISGLGGIHQNYTNPFRVRVQTGFIISFRSHTTGLARTEARAKFLGWGESTLLLAIKHVVVTELIFTALLYKRIVHIFTHFGLKCGSIRVHSDLIQFVKLIPKVRKGTPVRFQALGGGGSCLGLRIHGISKIIASKKTIILSSTQVPAPYPAIIHSELLHRVVPAYTKYHYQRQRLHRARRIR